MIKLKDLIQEDISMSQLNQVEKHLDKIWAKVGIDVEFTRHFHDRVNDERNKKPISTAEIIWIYREIYKKYGKPISKLSNGVEILLKETDLLESTAIFQEDATRRILKTLVDFDNDGSYRVFTKGIHKNVKIKCDVSMNNAGWWSTIMEHH